MSANASQNAISKLFPIPAVIIQVFPSLEYSSGRNFKLPSETYFSIHSFVRCWTCSKVPNIVWVAPSSSGFWTLGSEPPLKHAVKETSAMPAMRINGMRIVPVPF